MRKNASDLTVDQVLIWVTAVLIVGVFNWPWWVLADNQFRDVFWRIGLSPMTAFGLR